MKNSDFARALRLAQDLSQDLSQVDDSAIFGCGLPGFKPVFVTVKQVAKFIRWQSLCLNGNFDSEAIAECAQIARKVFVTIDPS